MLIRRVVTTREGGYSRPPFDSFNLGGRVGDDPEALAANQAKLARGIGIDEHRFVWMEQVHGRTATVVDGPRDEPVEVTDALVTAAPRLPLVVLTADCVPVLLGDPVSGVVGAVHAGRVGARIGVLVSALREMVAAGARIDRVEALLGPAACGECYEVPVEMRDEVERALPGSSSKTRRGTPGLDLRAGLWEQLAAAGVGRIGQDPRCTLESSELFSHRRDGERTGRIAAVVWSESEGQQ
ncbi:MULTISPECIES: peptidoglycan editing factor PgeF [unclassified Actinopolyspora]|uniref:peptidoglycan editing factor PgeF n=1 Tax=unclassified Actinopolyspora TaxID=2639451 RepID=UPI0013F627AF|nr:MULTISPECIES: peptidoglycan editing factor PgeF [unclassified Actinopolyspora]NHD17120.1 peptidoglycan editing factor PgeF [Actinopolyspora sp. BKK2]NHE76272.1 peptidoglycan editing factor PgeF [Actinopolyspora sp. BKK1]